MDYCSQCWIYNILLGRRLSRGRWWDLLPFCQSLLHRSARPIAHVFFFTYLHKSLLETVEPHTHSKERETQKELWKSWPPSSEIQWIPTSPAAPSPPASPAFLLALLLPAQIRSYIFLFFSCKRSSLRHHILCHSKNFHLARRHSIHLFISLVLIQPSPAFAEEIEASRNHSNISLFTSIFNQI